MTAARAICSCMPSPINARSGSCWSSGCNPSSESTYGGFDTTRSHPSAAAPTSPSRRSTSRPRASAFSRASESASRETSTPATRASGRSSFSASAIAPEPTPMSSTRGASLPSSSARHRSTRTSVSGRGTRARASVFRTSRRKPHSPSTYASGSRASRRASSGSSAPSISRSGSGVQPAPRRAGDVRDDQLRVDARRLDAGGCEALFGFPQCVAKRQSPSARRRSSVVSAAVKSSSSPWRMRSS